MPTKTTTTAPPDVPQTPAEQYARAMDKIRDEMAKSKNPDVPAVGEAMTALLQARPEIAPAILTDGKTLDGLYAAMKDYATKHKKGNSYLMAPNTAQEIICGYFGFELRPDTCMRLYMEQVEQTTLPDNAEKSGENAEKRAGNADAATPKASPSQWGSTREAGDGALPLPAAAPETANISTLPTPNDPFDLDALLEGL